jgi:GTP-binding protein HflX
MIELGQQERERCVLVGVSTRHSSKENTEESLDELALLADTAGAEIFARVTQDRDRYDVSTFVGKGKVDELRTLVTENSVPLVIFDDDLTPGQVRNLEHELECKVLDRSGLILDIFASRAKSNEAKTQVELAQLQYLLPRLTRMWTHLSKQFGGVWTKGPGETQIETDRRIIKTRITHLKEKLDRIGQQRVTQRKSRTKHIRAALVGYTNVGKSTLLNLLSGSDVFVENRLFATLDPTTRLVPLSAGSEILMTDTVGFIRKLPHQLVASFKSTLEEITEADIILHLSDIMSRNFREQVDVVSSTLADLGVADKPTLMVFNKIDALADRSLIASTAEQFPHSVFISAKRGINILGLKAEVSKLLQEEFIDKKFTISQEDQRLISYLHTAGEVLEKDYREDSVTLSLRIKKKEFERVMSFVTKSQKAPLPS